MLRGESIKDADERQRVFQESLDNYLGSEHNFPALTPEVKDELFGRGVMAVTGARNDLRDAFTALKKVDSTYRFESEIIKADVDTGNDKDKLSKISRAFGINLFDNPYI